MLNRRHFTGLLAGGLGLGLVRPARAASLALEEDEESLPAAIRSLRPITGDAVPITDEERRARIARAQALMAEQRLRAVLLEPGTSMSYFTGMRWGLSERTFAAILPLQGEPVWICPAFEESRARELIRIGTDVRVWQEDESPFRLIADTVKGLPGSGSRLGVEERVRYFVADGVASAGRGMQLTNATPVTAGCRMFKSPAELALMQQATDVTTAAFKAAFQTMEEGMTQHQLSGNMAAAQRKLGGTNVWVLVGFGPAAALPHGSIQPQQLERDEIVLMDAGCEVEGYQSDMTRTTVFGTPTARQTEVWNLERKAQDAAFAAAKLGAPCETVDAAARKVITDAGFGPGYKVPGLPHRTGHGIGMDGHEWTNFVKGNKTPLAPGMCFSDEPMIAIPGEFGIRLEDCLYMTEQGPRFFSEQSPAIERIFP